LRRLIRWRDFSHLRFSRLPKIYLQIHPIHNCLNSSLFNFAIDCVVKPTSNEQKEI
jgi:hypothetical protein